jgi:hypothetical protein
MDIRRVKERIQTEIREEDERGHRREATVQGMHETFCVAIYILISFRASCVTYATHAHLIVLWVSMAF